MKKNLFFLLFTSCFFYGQAATWIGGQSSWNTASNWDTGSVPTIDDEVIIPSGGYPKIYNGSNAEAANIIVEANARLRIYSNGNLVVAKGNADDGIVNNGRIYISGNLEVYGFNGNAVANHGYIYAYSSATLTLFASGTGIKNHDFSYFYNAGIIDINSCGGFGIRNSDRFRNYGQTFIYEIGGTGVLCDGYFYNGNSALLEVKNVGSNGISTSSEFYNYGDVFVSYTGSIGMSIEDAAVNYASGKIVCVEAGNSAFYLIEGEVKNYGTMKAIDPYWSSLWMFDASFKNYGITEFLYPEVSQNLTVIKESYFYNYGYTTLSTDQSVDIRLGSVGYEGFIVNASGAVFEMSKRMVAYNSSSFTNDGFLYYNSPTTSSDSFNNYGVIQDRNNTFPTTTNNQQVIVRPFMGNLDVGVPYANALDLGALDNVTIGSWHVGPNSSSNIAGTYDGANNTFTPNSNAIGANELYVEITDDASGLSHYFEVPVQGNISSFTGEYNHVFQKRTNSQSLNDKSAKVYPNPSAGNLFLENDWFAKGDTDIQIYNSLGQLVFQTKVAKGQGTFSVELPKELSDGLYVIHSIQNSQTIAVQQIKLQRK